ncbi:hypothetical protein TYRP_015240 [Tyrophagus putrescentiae]|nr:hypothetical protein TYRP_015240 [Tyrophagus putrescentiae]
MFLSDFEKGDGGKVIRSTVLITTFILITNTITITGILFFLLLLLLLFLLHEHVVQVLVHDQTKVEHSQRLAGIVGAPSPLRHLSQQLINEGNAEHGVYVVSWVVGEAYVEKKNALLQLHTAVVKAEVRVMILKSVALISSTAAQCTVQTVN